MKKNVIITGATGNLGKASVEKFLAEGYKVIPIVSPGKASALSFNGDVEVYEADLTNETEVGTSIQTIIKKNKTIDAALLLVGGFAMGGIKETDGNQVKKMMRVNFDTAYYTARPIFEQMLTQPNGGRLVFIGSKPGLNPNDGKNAIAYALSKSLIFKLAELLNAEGAKRNVVSSVVVPSTIDTPENRQAMPQVDFSTWVNPSEIAEVMAFLSSDKGSALRETVFKVYGKS